MMSMNRRNVIIFVIVFLAGAGSGVLGVFLWDQFSSPAETFSQQIRQGGGYEYINPLLECEVAEGLLDARKENFHDDLEEYVVHLKQNKNLSDVALYFRDLNNGPTFGVNER